MGELVKYIAINLVDKPEEVKVVEKQGDHATIIELTVAPDDMGKGGKFKKGKKRFPFGF